MISHDCCCTQHKCVATMLEVIMLYTHYCLSEGLISSDVGEFVIRREHDSMGIISVHITTDFLSDGENWWKM